MVVHLTELRDGKIIGENFWLCLCEYFQKHLRCGPSNVKERSVLIVRGTHIMPGTWEVKEAEMEGFLEAPVHTHCLSAAGLQCHHHCTQMAESRPFDLSKLLTALCKSILNL